MDLRLDIHLTSGNEPPRGVLANARDLHLVAYVERLTLFGGVEKNTESTREVYDVLLADLVHCVVLGLYRHHERCRVGHTVVLRCGISHSRHVLAEYLWQYLIEAGVLLACEAEALDQRRRDVGVCMLFHCRVVEIEHRIPSVRELSPIDMVHH